MNLLLSGRPNSALPATTSTPGPGRSRRVGRLLAAALALGAAAVPAAIVAAPAAEAATVRVYGDAARDVVQVPRSGSSSYIPVPAATVPDVRRTAVTLSGSLLEIRVRFAAPVPTSNFGLTGTIKTPARTYLFERVVAGQRGSYFLSKGRDGRSRCSGFSISYVDRLTVARVRVPARCIGRPSAVRLTLGVSSNVFQPSARVDDAFARGFRGDALAVSPRIRRG
ncbi:hypothetical protein [Nocardioides sp.]|uniref:hypothetical protein n=1 Tax=Nocardioides sp. TaxID=35761 RepID=UPI00351698B9